jgi:hypothetical protein
VFFDGFVMVTVGVMYDGAVVVAVVDGAAGDVLVVVALSGVVFSLTFASSLVVVPLSASNDAFDAMAGATGMATNGTAMNAARMHGSTRCAPCKMRCLTASLE